MSDARSPAEMAFAHLADAEVSYCLWRGTRRLADGLAGRGDIDLLVEPEHAPALATALLASGFRRPRTHALRADAGLEDYFAFDAAQCCFVHFHVHYRMVAGEPRLNRLRLPFEHEVLAARCPIPGTSVSGAAPAMEVVLLLLRRAVLWRWRDRWQPKVQRRWIEKTAGDLDALLRDCDLTEVEACARSWLGADGARAVSTAARELRVDTLLGVRAVAWRALADHVAWTGPAAAARRWGRELSLVWRALGLRLQGVPWVRARSAAAGGMLVLVRASDRAVARSLVSGLRGLFAAKFDVVAWPTVVGSGSTPWRRASRLRARGHLVLAPSAGAGAPERGADLVLALEDGDASDRGAVQAVDPLMHVVRVREDDSLAAAAAAIWSRC